jgi:hypothetical protein
LELWRAAGLDEAVARHVAVSGAQGWSERQMVSALVLLNLAGGDGLDDLNRLEADSALCRLVQAAEAHGREPAGAAGRDAALATAAVARAALAGCRGPLACGVHDAGEESRRQAGRAFIPASSEGAVGLGG